MKKYSKLLSLITAVMLIVSSVGFASDIDFDRIIENTNREYDEYITKALKEASNDGIEVDESKISVLLWQEPGSLDDSLEPNQIFVFVPEKTLTMYTDMHITKTENLQVSQRTLTLGEPLEMCIPKMQKMFWKKWQIPKK